MRFACSISSAKEADSAVDELLQTIDARVTPGMVDLALLFSTAHFEDDLEAVTERITTMFPNAILVGCTAEGTIGADEELERVPSMSLLAGSMPEVVIRPFHLRQSQLQGATALDDWERILGVLPESQPTILAFADPFRIAIPTFFDQMNQWFPGAPILGGIASGGHSPDQNRLLAGGAIVREGIVGVTLTGNLIVDTVVSQGCRPIAKPFVITKGESNIIHQLGGRAPLEQLHDVLRALPPEDEQLARQSLFVGRVIDERKGRFTRGDFLIQNIVGFDRKSGAIAIAGLAKVGATVQFHVRDADSADEDLRTMLSPYARDGVRGAMLFGCNGRGTNMWPHPGHDVGVLREILGEVPVAGFFCGGEFGPIGGNNFIHGFTASIGLIRPREKEPLV